MAIENKKELIDTVQKLMGASYSKVSDDGFLHAVNQAIMELHWDLPETDSIKCYWLIERARRHVISVLVVESANKFRYKDIHLHNRFNQYFKLITFMDDEFKNAIEEYPLLFDIGIHTNLFDYITTGFQYDFNGNDVTYGDY